MTILLKNDKTVLTCLNVAGYEVCDGFIRVFYNDYKVRCYKGYKVVE